MSYKFLALSLFYLAAMLVWVFANTPDGFSKLRSFQIGSYTYVVVCAVIVGSSALRHLLIRWARRELRLLKWPPMLVVLVIFWLVTKAAFFLQLWLYATEIWRDGVMLTVTLFAFAMANGLLASVWMHRRGMDVIAAEEEAGDGLDGHSPVHGGRGTETH